MLIRFRSTATESITMFGDVAVSLIKMMGASGTIPGAINGEDIPDALQKLRHQLQNAVAHTPATELENSQDEGNEQNREPPVGLATRAVPLVNILERAAAKQAAVMWEAA